jgi:hypothetical protein
MADQEKPEERAGKKGILGSVKIPLDGIVLVVAPFIIFLVLFMYVMGLLPPKPMTVNVVGAAVMDVGGAPAGEAEAVAVLPQGAVAPAEAAVMEPAMPDTAGGAGDAGNATGSEAGYSEAAPVGPDENASGEAEEAVVSEERLERMKQLAKVYEQMNATSVAAIVSSMNEEDAVGILSNMKPRNAGKVLASLEPEKAAKLSLRLTE